MAGLMVGGVGGWLGVRLFGGGGGGGAVLSVNSGPGVTVAPNVGNVVVSGALATLAAIGEEPATIGVSGAVPVDDGTGVDVRRQLTQDDILPAFSITSFARAGTFPSVLEIGDTLVNPRFAASYSAALVAPLNLINDAGPNTDPVALVAENSFGYNNFNASGLPARSFSKSTVNGTVLWTLSATKSPSGPTRTATILNTWEPLVFFGIATPAAFTAAFIHALPSSRLQPSFASNTYVIAGGIAGQHGYVAWPSSFGDPSSFTDVNTGFGAPGTKVAAAVPVTNGFGVTVNYDLWQTDSDIIIGITWKANP